MPRLPRVLLAALALGASAPAPSAPATPPGEGITPRIACAADPGQAYALYLPPSYDPAHPAPILFLLDARGRALVPLERFRRGAQRFGFVLASSYNSASDEAADPNGRALEAMWKDAAAHLSLDAARVYLGGFSGTARAACDLGLAAPERIAGVIAAGAGFAEGHPPSAGTSFAFFGTVGAEDFNYYELMDLDERLETLGVPHRIEVFPGGHEWMPEELATGALEWLVVRAARSARAGNKDFLSGEWSRSLERARRLESEGSRREALRAYRDLARDFGDLRDVSEAAEAKRRLEASEETRREQREWEERRRRETQALEEAWRVLGAAVQPSSAPVRPAKLLGDLRISEWRKKARGGGEEGISARRILETIRVQTGFYLPREEAARGNFQAEALLLEVAAAIRPEDPEAAYRLAEARARSGNPREALRALDRSLDAGFSDLDRLREDPAFDRIRTLPRYREIEEELIRKRSGPASGNPRAAPPRR